MADLTITAANVAYVSGNKINGTAGATVTAGQVVYKDAADGKYKLAQCDSAAPEAAAEGIALHGSLLNQPLTIAGNGAEINIGATTAKTTVYMVASTPGGIAPIVDIATTGWHLVKVGYAKNTTGTFVVDIVNHSAVV